MKKVMVLALILVAVFAAVSVVTACKSPPPPPPPEAPPPPPPPPEPVVEVKEEVPDMSPPIITLTLAPQPFSPDGDGVADKLTMNIRVTSVSPVGGWRLEIREPSPPYNVFFEWSGDGVPPARLEWDGLSADGELVQSASTYHLALNVSNQYDNATYQGAVVVDVLVRREGEILRVIVPSIVFASNSGNFTTPAPPSLTEEAVENNKKILARIAEVLEKFSTYHITVEGHANPTTAPGTRARTNEESGTSRVIGLRPLSQQRAQAVVDYLVSLSIDPSRLAAIGRGSSNVVAAYTDRDDWWKNRRVEFILEKEPEPVPESAQ